MKKSLFAILLLALLPVQAAFAEPRSEVVRVDVPANKTAQNELPAAMRRELERAMALVRNHQTAEAMPLLNRLVGQADAELRRHKNARAAGNRVHTLRLLLEAANSGRDTEVVSSEWLMPRYVRAFAHVEQKNYAAAAAELDTVLAVEGFCRRRTHIQALAGIRQNAARPSAGCFLPRRGIARLGLWGGGTRAMAGGGTILPPSLAAEPERPRGAKRIAVCAAASAVMCRLPEP